MVKSMTGFGRCEISEGDRKVTVEMKSVNHRYLDLGVKIPKKLGFFEPAVRNLVKKELKRGKVDVYISYEDLSESDKSLRYNALLAGRYAEYIRQISAEFGVPDDLTACSLSRYPDVLVMEEAEDDEDELRGLLERAVNGALEEMTRTRAAEGENLKKDLIGKLDELLIQVDFVEKRSPQLIAEYRAKLEEKVKELLADSQIDEGRVAAEVTIFADKVCIDEEIVRLKSHFQHMKSVLEEKEGAGKDGVGRKLDFIAQEMNREANTILSKANDLEISNAGIELKTGIEKIREQIQNVE